MGYTHICVGSNDLEKSRAFYDETLGAVGVKRARDMEDRAFYEGDGIRFIVLKPINGEAATSANGGTIGFPAPSPAAVDAFHAGALAKGGRSEGEPGERTQIPGSYVAYVRDPDGNKLCVFHMAG